MQKFLSLLLCVVLCSCSHLGALKGAAKLVTGAADSGGVSADLQVGGKREVAVDAALKNENVSLSNIQGPVSIAKTQTKGGVEKAEQVTINNNNPFVLFWLIAIGLVGWLLPTPKQCWGSIKQAWRKKWPE